MSRITAIIENEQLRWSEDGDDIIHQHPAFLDLLNILDMQSIDLGACTLEQEENNLVLKGALTTDLLGCQIDSFELYLDFRSDGRFDFEFAVQFQPLNVRNLIRNPIIPLTNIDAIAVILNTEMDKVELIYDSAEQTCYIGRLETQTEEDTAGVSLGSFSAVGLALENFGFEMMRTGRNNTGSAYFYSDLCIGETKVDISVRLPLAGAMLANCWEFNLNRGPIRLGLNELLDFVKEISEKNAPLQESVDFGAVIDGPTEQGSLPRLRQIPNFYIEDLKLQLAPDTLKILLLSFAIQSDESWAVVEDKFVIESLGLGATIQLFQNQKLYVLFGLFGEVSIDDRVTMDIGLTIPYGKEDEDWFFSLDGNVELENASQVSDMPIDTPWGELQLPASFMTLRNISVDTFEMNFNPMNKTISSLELDVLIDMECRLFKNISLSNPRFILEIADPFNHADERHVNGAVSGYLKFSNLEFYMEAEKRDQSWLFTGTIESLDIAEFVNSLDDVNITMPDYVKGMILDKLLLQFVTTHEDAVPTEITPNGEATIKDFEEEAGEDTGEDEGEEPPYSRTLTFACEGQFPLNADQTKALELLLNIFIESDSDGNYRWDIDAQCRLKLKTDENADQEKFLIFDLHAIHPQPQKTLMSATYADLTDETIEVRDLVAQLSDDVDEFIPPGLQRIFEGIF